MGTINLEIVYEAASLNLKIIWWGGWLGNLEVAKIRHYLN